MKSPYSKSQTEELEAKKLETHVDFNEELTLMGESIGGDRTYTHYKLRAVIVHIGKTISSGHYVALTKPHNSEGKLWCHYSDTCRESMSWKQVKQHQAYLLLYEKENTNPLRKAINRLIMLIINPHSQLIRG